MQVYDGGRYYHTIPGLLVPKSVTNDDVHTTINKYIDVIPNMAETLEDSLLNMSSASMKEFLVTTMDSLIVLLKGMYARGLETEAVRLLRCIKDDNMIATAKKNLKSFITEALSLSVAMQKAQNTEKAKQPKGLTKIEIYTNTAKSVAAVSSLLEDDLHEPARVLLADLAEHHPDTTIFTSLLKMISSGKIDDAKAAIKALNDKFNETLSKLAGTDLSKKILAVDDMPEILSFVNNALKSHYKVIAVPGGKAALKVMESQKPDLFILDIDMPEMDGFELAIKIRQNPDHARTPIIFLTGNSSRAHIDRATMVGGNEFIVKPATHEYLLTKVGGFLNE
jgi:PleD family two-component response regulator